MFALNLPFPVFLWMFTLFQTSPAPSPLRVSVVSAKSFWPENLVEWAGLLSAVAIIGGGLWGLFIYRAGKRLKAAEVLLSMEQEFRIILPTYELLENPGVYEAKIKPLLIDVRNKSNLSNNSIKLLSRLDRCLRFLFLCSVLNRDLAVEQNVLVRSYYYYVGILATLTDENNTENTDLAQYIKDFYPTLRDWTNVNRTRLACYRAGQVKKPRRFWKFLGRGGSF